MSSFQQNSESILHTLLQGQNYFKSEILLLREELTELKDIKNQEKNEQEKKKEVVTKKDEKKTEEPKPKEKKENHKKENEKQKKEKQIIVEDVNNQDKNLEAKKMDPFKDNHESKARGSYSANNKKAIEKIIQFGTSVSKPLERNKFEKDTNTKVKVVKAYGIEGDCNQRYPGANFKKVVTETLEK